VLAIEHLPIGSEFDLWKQLYAQIRSEKTEKLVKFAKVIHCHLGIEGEPPASYRIAPHHFPIALLEWQAKKQNVSGFVHFQNKKQ